MLGKSHMIANLCSLELLWISGKVLGTYQGYGHEYIDAAAAACSAYLSAPDGVPVIIHIGTSFGLFLLGTLLPDCDTKTSLLGRYFCLPFEHHTWTHTVYACIAFGFFSIWYQSLFWILAGYVLHLFWDSFSACGVCWFYKLFSDYREYPSGARVKKGHKCKLYRTGKNSEYVLLAVLVTTSVIIGLLFAYFHYGGTIRQIFA